MRYDRPQKHTYRPLFKNHCIRFLVLCLLGPEAYFPSLCPILPCWLQVGRFLSLTTSSGCRNSLLELASLAKALPHALCCASFHFCVYAALSSGPVCSLPGRRCISGPLSVGTLWKCVQVPDRPFVPFDKKALLFFH